MNKSLSIFAKALASENISFSFDPNAKTAAFDVQNRHLIMPVWNVSPVLQSMLIAHEISHALWTPYEASDRLLRQAEAEGYCPKTVQRIANVIEDVRIERLMKEKYPGTRRDFFLGYKEIVDTDLFEFSKMDMDKAGPLTRINLHMKWGIPGFMSVNLDEVEKEIVDEILAVETFEEVIALAKRLCNSDHKPLRDEIEKMKQKFASGQGDEDGNQGEEMVPGEGMDGLKDVGECIGRKTGETYDASSLVISPLTNYKDQIISTDEVHQIMRLRGVYNSDRIIDNYRQFVRESDAFVRQLVAQFERRKAADEIRKERPKQTGNLNLDRLHEYRTADDIFLSKIVKQDGKNHGIVFMIDFSGSMGSVLENCILQVMQLVWFCEKAKIPFEVFAFTDMPRPFDSGREAARKEYIKANPDDPWGERFVYHTDPQTASKHPNAIKINGAKLINLASSRDGREVREQILAGLYAAYCGEARGSRPIPMGGTPTVESIMLVSQFMQEWVRDNNIQIPTLMVVTDGQPNSINVQDEEKFGRPFYYMEENHNLTVTNEVFGTVYSMSGKDYSHTNLSNAIIATMLESIRTSLNARIVGMYVGGRTFSDNDYGTFCVGQKEWRGQARGKVYDTISSPRFKKAAQMYKEDGCIVLHDSIFPGYDAYFLIKTPKAVRDEEAIVESGTFAKIKNTFVKTMGKRNSSRVFLSKYIDIVAGQPLRKTADGLYNLPPFHYPYGTGS